MWRTGKFGTRFLRRLKGMLRGVGLAFRRLLTCVHVSRLHSVSLNECLDSAMVRLRRNRRAPKSHVARDEDLFRKAADVFCKPPDLRVRRKRKITTESAIPPIRNKSLVDLDIPIGSKRSACLPP